MIAIETNLKLLRLDQIGTQADLGKLIGVSKPEISKWERKKRFPSKTNLIKLEQLFGKPHGFLFAEARKEDDNEQTNSQSRLPTV